MTYPVLQSLRLNGYSPKTLLDVGANVGEYTREFLVIFPGCVPTLIEPNPHCMAYLKPLNCELLAAAASESNGTAEIYLTKEWLESTGASLYRENTDFFRDEVLVTETIRTVRLDDCFADRTFDFVKIDVQGGEMDVLNGGTEVIRRADYVMIEVPIVEYNTGAPPAERIFEKLKEMGFRCVDAINFHRLGAIMGGNLLQIDFLFERLRPRASQNACLAQASDVVPYVVDFINEQKRICPDFSVLNIGPLREPWMPDFVDASFNTNASATAGLHFNGALSDAKAWEPILDYVDRHGKFAYSLCTHILEDVALPSLALEMLPRVADAGHICVSSKYAELMRHEGPYRGHINHRWIFCVKNGVITLVPKISLIDEMPFPDENEWGRKPNMWKLYIQWRKGIKFELLNHDYLGPTPEDVVRMYAAVLGGPDT